MIGLALLLLAAGSATVDLVDETFEIPPDEWRYVELSLKQEPVTVWCSFETLHPRRKVRVALLRRGDLERMRADQPHGILASVPADRGVLHHTIAAPGDFAVLVDNRAESGRATRVHLRVWLDFSRPSEPHVRYVPATRRLVVVALSLSFFVATVVFSVRRLRRRTRD